METREQELERLVKEQARDDSTRIWPEHSLVVGRILQEDGDEWIALRQVPTGCPIHGLKDYRAYPWGFRCRICATDHERAKRRRRGIQPRRDPSKEGCVIHGLEDYHLYTDKQGRRRGGWCNICKREYQRARREALRNAQ